MYVGVLTLLSMTTTEKERALYMGFPGITWGIGTVLGPIIGGAFAESKATWRWGVSVDRGRPMENRPLTVRPVLHQSLRGSFLRSGLPVSGAFEGSSTAYRSAKQSSQH